MAYERTGTTTDTKTLGDNLDSFISNTMKLYQQQVDIRNANEESSFFKTVADNNLTLEDQLAYRKEQLKRVQDDPSEKKRLTQEISSLKTRVEQKQFTEDYLSKVSELGSGISSIDSVISWLQGQKATATDPDIITSIDKALSDQESNKFTLTQQLLKNQTDFATNDKSADVINTQIGRVQSAKAAALLSGNDALASTYDLQLQQLNKALNENSVTKDVANMAVSAVTGGTALGTLDAYNAKISNASPTGSITIGGVTYASPQEFWKFKRDSYVADSSSNGFFANFNNDINTQLKVKNSNNTLSTNDIKNASTAYDALATRPELAQFTQQIMTNRQDSIQTGTDLVAKSILNTYSLNYDLNSAVTQLNNLKSLGGNVGDTYTTILTNGATVNKQAIDSILAKASQLIQADPNLSAQDAIAKATAGGAGVTLSPEQLTSKTPQQTTNELATGAGSSAFTNPDKRISSPAATATPGVTAPPVVPPAPTNQNGGTPASTTPKPTYTINKQLNFGVTDPQVKSLQQFLNSQGFTVASSGAGSAGNETDYFGPLTQQALQKFQASKGIVSSGDAATTGYGRLGPQTLSAISKILGY